MAEDGKGPFCTSLIVKVNTISNSNSMWNGQPFETHGQMVCSSHSCIFIKTNCLLNILIGSLTAKHKASYSLVFSDIKYRQNIAGR